MSSVVTKPWRYLAVLVAIAVGFTLVFVRVVYLHLYGSGQARMEHESRKRIVQIDARRGDIVDARGNALAVTEMVYDLGVDPSVARPDRDRSKWAALALLSGVDRTKIDELMEPAADGSVRWRFIAKGIRRDRYEAILNLGIHGVYGHVREDRNYPSGELAAQAIGFTDADGVGRLGIEAAMEDYLSGENGWYETEVDAKGQELPRFRNREVAPRHGNTVQLTLDAVIQHAAEAELQRIVEEYSPRSASIVVSEAQTGFIRAIANVPTFDLNHVRRLPPDILRDEDRSPLRNRAIADVYEPGSTFKIVPIAAALEEGIVRPSSLLDCRLTAVRYQDRIVPLPKDHVNEPLTVAEIVSRSSTRGAVQLGMILGDERLYAYAHAFGFGESTGAPLREEQPGLLWQVADWDNYTIRSLPMGHAVEVTPLQVHFAMSTIANRGILMRPILIRRVTGAEGVKVFDYEPEARRRVIREETALTVSRLLTGTASRGGTAAEAEIPGFEVAGKTGTTQKLINRQYVNDRHIVSFSGFFPASRPRVVVTVVVDDPQLDLPASGGRVAAPAFRRLSERLIQYLAIQPVTPQGDLRLARAGDRTLNQP